MKVLIADDEDYTREGLIETVCWEKFGVDEIMQAVNGAEAVKIAQWFRPDIVISDIRMPQVNGLEFAERVTKMNPDSRIIFISGYMEIEYLKSAIRLDAVDYIEKPIDLQALKKAVEKAADEVRRIHRGREEARERKELQQQKLFRLLTAKEPDERTLDKLFAETKALGKEGCFQCVAAMFRAEQKDGVQPAPAEGMAKLEQLLAGSGFRTISCWKEEKQQCEFVISYQEKEQYRLMPLYQRILEQMPRLCLGVGIEAQSYRNVYNSYRTADVALNRAFYHTDRRLFVIDTMITQKNFINPGIYGEFLQVMSGPPAQMTKWCRGLFERLYQHQDYRKEQVCTLLISFLNAMYQKYPYLYELCPSIRREEEIAAYVMGMRSLLEIESLFGSVLDCIGERQQEQAGYSRVVCGVLEYIEKHYGEESLSITQIADQLHLSSAYLNVLFRQEMKQTLKQYLSNYRLEKARRMLEQDFDKITEIAEKCGYANSNYFAKVFREAEGMTPLEYRKQKGGGNGGQ